MTSSLVAGSNLEINANFGLVDAAKVAGLYFFREFSIMQIFSILLAILSAVGEEV